MRSGVQACPSERTGAVKLKPGGWRVRKTREILRRLARQDREATQEKFQIKAGSYGTREARERCGPPTKEGDRKSLASILLAETKGQHHSYSSAAEILIGACGEIEIGKLSHAQIVEANHILDGKPWAVSTKRLIGATMRLLLRTLWENYGAPKLDEDVRHYPTTKPRNVTVEREEIERLLDAAPEHIRLWLLLCSDMAIRSGTAARLGFRNYSAERGELAFITSAKNE
jgi:integrase